MIKKTDYHLEFQQLDKIWSKKRLFIIIISVAVNIILGYLSAVRESYFVKMENQKFHDWAEASKELCPIGNDTFCSTACWTGKKFVDYGYMHQPNCSPYSSKSLLIYVYSSVQNFDRREILRQHFKQHFNTKTTPSASLVFVVGKSSDSADSKLQMKVDLEQKLNEDLLQIDMEEAYFMLSYKGIGLFKWIKKCWQDVPNLVAKIDDDHPSIFPTISYFAKYILSKEDAKALDNSLFCLFSLRLRSTNMLDFFSYHAPDFCMGDQGVFMTKEVAMKLYAAVHGRRVFRLDDFYMTGILRQRACLQIKSYDTFLNVIADFIYFIYVRLDNLKNMERWAVKELYTVDDFVFD